MLYNWHRYYDPSIGRYISADPIGQIESREINLYSYAFNDPANRSDPYGLFVNSPPVPLPPVAPGSAVAAPGLAPAAGLAVAGGVGYLVGTLIEPYVAPYVETAVDYYFGDPLEDEDCDRRNCDAQYENDLDTCRAIGRQGQKKRAERCYSSALLRKIACEQGRPLPPLSIWNN